MKDLIAIPNGILTVCCLLFVSTAYLIKQTGLVKSLSFKCCTVYQFVAIKIVGAIVIFSFLKVHTNTKVKFNLILNRYR